MQRWQDELLKHPLMATIQTIDEAISLDQPITDPVAETERTRLIKIIGLLKNIIDQIDPDLAPLDVLNAINSQIRNSSFISNIQQFSNNGNVNHLIDANSQITPILGYLYQLSSLKLARVSRRADQNAATTSFQNFSDAISLKYDELTEKGTKAYSFVEEQLKKSYDISVQVDVIKASVDNKLAEWDNAQVERARQQVSEFNEMINAAKKEAATKLDKIDKETTAKFLKLYTDENGRANENIETLQVSIKEVLDDARDKREKILELYDLVAHDSITGGHKQIADREYDSAFYWRLGTMASIALTLGWLLLSLLLIEPSQETNELFWLDVVKSAVITGLLMSFSIYASKQSNLHRINERKMRAFFLQVQAFDPFVKNLPDDARSELKRQLSERIFGGVDGTPDDALDEASFKGIDHIGAIVERLLKAAKK